jgi:alpha-beta hydrolase superfamily lysophospholipase
MRTQPNRPYADGLGEHIGRYTGLIGYLAQAGFLVYGNDYRGHRHTCLRRTIPTEVNKLRSYEAGAAQEALR